MKKLLLAFLLFAGTTSASDIRLGLNVGLNGSSIPAGGPYASLKALYQCPLLELGGGIDYFGAMWDETYTYSRHTTPTIVYHSKIQNIVPHLLANVKSRAGKHTMLYFGIHAGLIFSITQPYYPFYDNANKTVTVVVEPVELTRGLSAGGQIGARFGITKRLSINTELAARMAVIGKRETFLYVPFSIGISYRT